MGKIIIETPKAPKPAGPYSQAVRAGNLLFISGQIPIDPRTGEIVRAGIEEQARRVMENIGAILHSQEISFENVVKATIYLSDISGIEAVNRVFREYFQSGPPARACVQASRLPGGVDLEIDAVAVVC